MLSEATDGWKYKPEEHEQILEKWWADGGDREFRYTYCLEQDSLVLDLGGHQGDWAAGISERYKCMVLIFEPLLAYAWRIAARFEGNTDIHVLPFGLGASDRTETLRLAGDASSIFLSSGPTEEIRIVDAAQWFKENAVETVALMKINIEGGEYELLECMLESGLTHLIDHIQVQFHPIEPESGLRMNRIQEGLSRTHRLAWQYPFVWESWTRKDLPESATHTTKQSS